MVEYFLRTHAHNLLRDLRHFFSVLIQKLAFNISDYLLRILHNSFTSKMCMKTIALDIVHKMSAEYRS